jgi:hypothetical protein
MKARLKEDPREWRKNVLLTALGLALLSSVLRWRHILSARTWLGVLAFCGLWALLAGLQPRWFRGWYRLSTRAGFWLSQIVARVVLVAMFFLLITPLGFLFRVLGKDPLRLKRLGGSATYFQPARASGPLDRLF